MRTDLGSFSNSLQQSGSLSGAASSSRYKMCSKLTPRIVFVYPASLSSLCLSPSLLVPGPFGPSPLQAVRAGCFVCSSKLVCPVCSASVFCSGCAFSGCPSAPGAPLALALWLLRLLRADKHAPRPSKHASTNMRPSVVTKLQKGRKTLYSGQRNCGGLLVSSHVEVKFIGLTTVRCYHTLKNLWGRVGAKRGRGGGEVCGAGVLGGVRVSGGLCFCR